MRKLKNALIKIVLAQLMPIPGIAAISVCMLMIIWIPKPTVVVGIHIAPHKLKPRH
jgi:hypothetical protein